MPRTTGRADASSSARRVPYVLGMIFAVLTAGILIGGHFYYRGHERHYRAEVGRQLNAIADLKVAELVDWRQERLGDAAILFNNDAFSALVRRYLDKPGDAEAQNHLRTWLGQFQARLSYDRVYLLDTQGIARVAVPDTPEPVAPHLARHAAEAMRSGKVSFLDFHRDAPDGPIHLSILVPVIEGRGDKRPLGVLVLRIDPATYLYPFINRWPTPSPTAETLIVRRDGDDALFLNELRFRKNTALSLRIPLTRTETPAVMAALGREGIVEGLDYRGVPVIAAIRAVPDSPWFLVARMDKAELYAPLSERLWLTAVLIGALLLAAGAGTVLVWRHQRARFYREKAEAADALRESEEKSRTLFQTMAQGVVYQDADGKIVSANPAAERILGLSLDQLQGRASVDPRWRAIHEDGSDFPGETHPSMVALRTGKEVRNVAMGVFNPRQESYLWISICAVPEFRPGESQPYQVYTTFDDITERKQAEETLKKSARLLMDTGEMAQVGGWELDLATKEVSWTEEVGRIHGVEPGFRPKLEEALSFYAAESRPALEAVLKKAAETGEPYDLESLFIPSGSKDKIWVRSLGRAVYSGGKIVKLTGTFQNIDKYKRVEEALRQSEEGFRTLVESITDYAYKATVRDGRVVETVHGAGCLGVTGYSPEEFRAAPELWFRMVHPEDQHAVLDRANKLLSGRNAGPLEHRIIHKNGETRWVRSSAVPRHDGRGQFIGYEGLIQDFTDYKRLRDQFARAQKMEAIGQLAGGVAHDFRNQLSVIKGYGEMLLRRDLVKDEGRIKVEQILEAADRSTRITGQLLAFGRKQTLRPEVANVNSVTGDMMKSLARTLGEDIRLSIVPRGELWNIRVDTGQFQQALLNLVLNARDAMAQGGQLTIETENIVLDEDFVSRHVGASAGRHVVLTVSDTGCGMSHEMLDRLFEPFFTTKPVGEGTGLGLAMVHGFVAQSGGFIDVQSRPDKPAGHGTPAVPGGTTFRLYFPAVQDAAESAQSPSPAPDLPHGSGTILVVEDEDAIRQILLETLGECGYTVLTAGNAQQAMTLIESAKEKIDLLITDVVMPGWSGPELARHFQASRPGAAVLLISGHTGKMLTGHGVVPADVNLLAKPFSAQTLAETVRKILGQTKRP